MTAHAQLCPRSCGDLVPCWERARWLLQEPCTCPCRPAAAARPLCLSLGFRSQFTADTSASWPFSIISNTLSKCARASAEAARGCALAVEFMEHLVARHLDGQELKLAEELLFQWFLPPLNYFSFKNKFLNISPTFYAKPQSSI